MPANAFDLVTLRQVYPPGPTERCHLVGDDTVGGGNARWDVLERPRRTSVIEWTGTDLETLELPLILDGFGTLPGGGDLWVEPGIQRLRSWRRPVPSLGHPPAITIAGGPVRQPEYTPWWVVTDLAWGAQIRDGYGNRVQQEVTVSLLEWSRGDIVMGPAAAARARAGR